MCHEEWEHSSRYNLITCSESGAILSLANYIAYIGNSVDMVYGTSESTASSVNAKNFLYGCGYNNVRLVKSD